MFQRDPLRQNVHKHILLMVLYTLFTAFLLFILLSKLLSAHPFTSTNLHMTIIYVMLFLLLFLSLVFIWRWFWSMSRIIRRRRQKRLRALQGDQDLLFPIETAQPLRNEHALVLPTTIEVKMRMTIFFLLISGLVVIDLLLLAIAFYIQKRSFEDLQFLLFTDGYMLLFSILVVWLAARIAARYTHQHIAVTEQGITTRYRGKTMNLAWNDARFFSLHGSTRSKHLFLYELSSAKGSVVWMQLRSNSFLLKPLIPFEHYQQKMKALSELVEAKTDLPLYDLRDTSNDWFS